MRIEFMPRTMQKKQMNGYNEKDTTDWITLALGQAPTYESVNWDTNSSCPESGAGAIHLALNTVDSLTAILCLRI